MNMPTINEIEYVTDGCGSQYKSKGYFKNLCSQEKELGMAVSHTYFATSHGKSQCDADGGSVKRKVRVASLQRPLDNQLINAIDVFEYCKTNIHNDFHFEFVLKTEVEILRPSYKEDMEKLETLPGTRTFHHIKPINGKLKHINFIDFGNILIVIKQKN